jgi:hypothetical protein
LSSSKNPALSVCLFHVVTPSAASFNNTLPTNLWCSFWAQRMRQAGAFLTTGESALFDIMRDAKHDHFKAIARFGIHLDEQKQ